MSRDNASLALEQAPEDIGGAVCRRRYQQLLGFCRKLTVLLGGGGTATARLFNTGFDATGVHADRTYSGALQFRPECLCQAAYRELGNVVSALGGKAQQTEDTGNIDDAALFLFSIKGRNALVP